jgi:hypothetical protein
MKKAMIEIDGRCFYTCDYKNCQDIQKEGWAYCEKHIEQRKKDLKKIRLNKLNKFLGITS